MKTGVRGASRDSWGWERVRMPGRWERLETGDLRPARELLWQVVDRKGCVSQVAGARRTWQPKGCGEGKGGV